MSIAAGASSGSSRRDAKSVSTTKLTLISPMVSVTGSISTRTRRTAGSRQSSTIVRLAVEPAEPRERKQQLHQRPENDDAGIEVELRVLVVDPWHAEDEAEDDDEVPCDRRERRDCELVIRVQDPDDDPGQPEQHDDREEHARQPDGEVEVAARDRRRAASAAAPAG